jgi:hypothetical protein
MTASSRDPVMVARAARRLIQSGDWQQRIANDPRTKVMMSLKAKMPWAVGHLPVDGLVALTKESGCHWCAAVVQRLPDRPELEHTEANLALLGEGCQGCRTRWEAAAVADREAAHVDQLVAAGFRPQAAANLRTPEQVADYTRRLRGLETAKLPPRPRPSASSARRRRNSDPPYYIRGSWPAEGTR